MVDLCTKIVNCDSHSPALLDLFSAVAFFPLGHSDNVVSVSIDFSSKSIGMHSFHSKADGYSHANGMPSMIILEMFHGMVSLNLNGKFCEWVRDGINVCIPHHKD